MVEELAESGGLQEVTRGSALPEMSMLAALPIPVVVTKLPGREIVFANAACQAALGRTAEEFNGLSVDDITAPEDRAHVESTIERIRDGGAVIEKSYLHGDGSVRRMRLHAITVTGFEGYAVALLFDVTKTTRSLSRLKLLAEAAALVPGADIGIDTVSATIGAMASEHLGSNVEVVWFDEPRSILDDASPDPVRTGDQLCCPIVVTDNVLGEVRVVSTDSDGDEDDELLCLESLAHCLAGASSVAALDTSLRTAELFERGFDATDVGMQIVDEDGVFLRVNRSFAAMVERTQEELVGMHWTEVTHPDDVAMHDDGEVRRKLDGGDGAIYRDVKRYLADDGSVKFGTITITSVMGNSTTDLPFRLVQVVEVTDQIRSLNDLAVARRDLTASELRYRSLVEPAPDAVFRINALGAVVDANASAERIFDFDAIIGAPIADLLPETFADELVAMAQRVMETGTQHQIDRQRLQLADGSAGWFLTRVVPEDSTGTSPTAHVVMSDITRMVENEERLSAMARIDPVTGVANRVALYERLERALGSIDETAGSCVAVAAIGLDHFKTVNDSFGHAFGDEAIRLFARAVDAALGPDDMFGRLGGDEFLLVLADQPSERSAEQIVERLVAMITPLRLDAEDGRSISLSASTGLVVATTSADDVDDVIEMADSALLEAKRTGRGRLVVSGATSGQGTHKPSLRVQLHDLLDADVRGEYELLYQPIIGADGYARSVEALIRWNHPDRGQLTPDHFIDALIHSGRIEGVGRWVVSTAVRQIEEWDALGLDQLSLNVNVSPGELAHPGFCAHLRSTIEKSSIDPSRIRIEITELALAGTFVPIAMLEDLSNTGARIVLDDFGTGVSSLSHLRVKSLSGIKIDRSFLTHAAEDVVDRGIVEGMIALAHNIGVDVTVEGVETEGQAEWLAGTGCEAMQGWLFSRAIPADAVPDMATQRFDMPRTH